MDTSATQWTPGPWRIGTSGSMANIIEGQSGRKLNDLDDGFRAVAMFQACCASDHFIDKEVNAKANGFLIAAAPDLYEALAAAVATIERDRLLWSSFPQQRKDDWELMLSEMKAALKKARGAQP